MPKGLVRQLGGSVEKRSPRRRCCTRSRRAPGARPGALPHALPYARPWLGALPYAGIAPPCQRLRSLAARRALAFGRRADTGRLWGTRTRLICRLLDWAPVLPIGGSAGRAERVAEHTEQRGGEGLRQG